VLRHLEVHDHDRLKEMCGHDERTVSRETWSIYLMFLYLNGQNLGGVPPEFMGVHYPVIAESLEDDLGPHPGIDKPSTERPCRQCGEKALADGSVVPKNQ
jgi:hypothetical protein